MSLNLSRPEIHFIAYCLSLTYANHIATTAAAITPSVLATFARTCLNCGALLSAMRFMNAGGALPLGKGLSGTVLSKKAHKDSLYDYQPRLNLKQTENEEQKHEIGQHANRLPPSSSDNSPLPAYLPVGDNTPDRHPHHASQNCRRRNHSRIAP